MSSHQDLDAALAILKEHKVRITPQRRLVLNYLITHHNHPSVETISQSLAQEIPNLSVATIYNNLKKFVELGIVIELPSENGGIRYDYFGHPHYHVICKNCGKIADVFSPAYAEIEQTLRDEAAKRTGYLVTGDHVEVYGYCPDCQKKLHLNQ
ncbi:Fe2+ Zn2+ uptake regulation protein [Lactobacillus selangorensis]|uniref:Fe2+ Zn2+ uptake regulation protein n=1 Tax=Lactobacillus selangorensis TaxID=81857 RepID=A0A0R2FZS0_9LACO|nr:Fe2+ Zn2+ uptake regulation protein [Lactobacillus selangorensis]KRN33704.1 Fe2+ Zn2+ uptake regulation protein [Lactobacillus selangorensis]